MIKKIITQAQQMLSLDFISENTHLIENIDGGFEECNISFYIDGKFLFIDFSNYRYESHTVLNPK
jgi:hypothetical protein